MTWPTDRPGDEVRELAIELALPLDVAERVLAYGKTERRAGYDAALTEVEQGIALPATICARIDAAAQAEREAIQKAIIAEINDPRNGGCDGYGKGLRDGLRSARILAARGPTPALDAALAQARQETWEKAREAARNVHPSAASATGEAHMRSYRDAIVHAISAAAGEEG